MADRFFDGQPNSRNALAALEKLFVLVLYDDDYVRPMIFNAIQKCLPPDAYSLISSIEDLPSSDSPVLQFSSYERLSFDHLLAHPATSVANAYVIRKALIRKHLLAITVKHWIAKHPESELAKHVLPTVNFEIDYAEFLDEALVEAFELHDSFRRNEEKHADQREWWILKAGMADKGQAVRLFSSYTELQNIFEEWEAAMPDDTADDGSDSEVQCAPTQSTAQGKRVDDQNDAIMVSQLRHFVAQPYIQTPLLLLDSQRKFHLRVYVLAIGSLRVYVYKDILTLFAAVPYLPPSKSHDLSRHLTNTCLSNAPPEGSVMRFWDLPEMTSMLGASWKEDVFDQICSTTAEVFKAAAQGMVTHFQTLPNAFEIFGLDYLVDEKGRVWLLEVNAFPDFKQTGNLLRGLVEQLFRGVIALVLTHFFKLGEACRPENHGEMLVKVLDVDLGRR